MKEEKKKHNKRWNLWHLLGFHKHLNCVEYGDFGGDFKIEYPNPWSLFGVKYNRYQCLECGRKFWMPKGNFEEIKSNERFFKSLNNKINPSKGG